MAKKKYYVVWNGVNPGIYNTWEECQQQIKGYPGAIYKSFSSEVEAEEAYHAPAHAYVAPAGRKPATDKAAECARRVGCSGVEDHTGASTKDAAPKVYHLSNGEKISNGVLPIGVVPEALAVDAACSGNPGPMEYRGVYLLNGQQIFHFGPVHGTNNIGEFLAIVHALALLKQRNLPHMPIYSDSRNALLWVKQKKCKTTLKRNARTEGLFQLIERAEKWLKENKYSNPLIKWETEKWGEVPADFGRK